MTKASFDTIGGLIIACCAIELVEQNYSEGNWWRLAMNAIFIALGVWMFIDGYNNLPKK